MQAYAIGSEDATFEHWLSLVREIERIAPDHAGVVVMHGTDTMEEAAHFINECLPGIPVTLCGAMRPPGTQGYDGGPQSARCRHGRPGPAGVAGWERWW